MYILLMSLLLLLSNIYVNNNPKDTEGYVLSTAAVEYINDELNYNEFDDYSHIYSENDDSYIHYYDIDRTYQLIAESDIPENMQTSERIVAEYDEFIYYMSLSKLYQQIESAIMGIISVGITLTAMTVIMSTSRIWKGNEDDYEWEEWETWDDDDN